VADEIPTPPDGEQPDGAPLADDGADVRADEAAGDGASAGGGGTEGNPTFSIVGIGASAGGLKAIRSFFAALPAEPGMAFVVVQHLSPDHESALADLVQTQTQMTVSQIDAHAGVVPNRVYVIPPGKYLEIDRGRLQLVAPVHERGRASAIDHFFRTMAEDIGERAVAIVLSGTGSDGTLGLKAVKERGGLTMAQDPVESEYDGMPRSAVVTGLVDIVGTAAELAGELVRMRDAASQIDVSVPEWSTERALKSIFAYLRQRTGHDFSDYKPSTIRRRLRRRLQVHGIESLTEYASFLRKTPSEAGALLRDFLISVTQFFRDPEAFEVLEHDVIPSLFEGRDRHDAVRVWVAGCATGEEAYSIAMLLCEERDRLDRHTEIQVFATDIDDDALAVARDGRYPTAAVGDVAPDRVRRFFDEEPNGVRIKPGLRDCVLFAHHNLLSDPPFSRLDLVSCRNVLIYLNRAVQERVLTSFHYGLRPEAVLFLGSAEGIDVLSRGFSEIDKSVRIYRRRDVNLGPARLGGLAPPRRVDPAAPPPAVERPTGLVERYQDWTLAAYAPPRLLVDDQHEVTHVFGRAGDYLHDGEGPISNQVVDKVLHGFRTDLRAALYRAFSHGEVTDTSFRRIEVGGEERVVRLHVGPAAGPAEADGVVEVVFIELDPASVAALGVASHDLAAEGASEDPAMARLEEEVRQTRERLQATIEEQETSNEELKASNEELQSMNEELQSTTEELETSREELQSMNEELHTVNQELKVKVEELTRTNSDLNNLIASTQIATLFLDRDLRVQRYTPVAATLFNLIPGDVGRPFDHVTHHLAHDGLADLVRGVIDTLRPVEEEIEGEGRRWYVFRAFPYRTVDDRIEGAVVTVIDVSAQKYAEQEAARRARQQEAVATLGQFALSGAPLQEVFDQACSLVHDAMESPLVKVLSHRPEAGVLDLVSGLGWPDGAVGTVNVPDDRNSQAGFTLLNQGAVVVPDIGTEARFTGPSLLIENGAKSGISVVIPGIGPDPYGVLGVHARQPRHFSDDDALFMEAVANVIGAAVRRARDRATIQEQLGEIEAVYATAPVGLAFLDADLRYRRINSQLAEINGVSVEEHRGRRPHEVVGVVGATQEPLLQRVLDSGESVLDVEVRGETPGSAGERVWLNSYVPRRAPDGTIVGVGAVVRDITDRKAQEEVLADTALRLELAMAGSGLGSFESDLTTDVVVYDARAQALLGIADRIGRGEARERIPGDERLRYLAEVEVACDPAIDDDAFIAEYPWTRPDGSTMWVASRGVCIFDGNEPDRRPLRLHGVVLDVTDIKEAEARARRQLAELDSYFEAVPVAIAAVDHRSRLVHVNRRFCELVGRSPEELIGEDPGAIFPDEIRASGGYVQRVLRTGVPIRDVELHIPPPSDPERRPRDWILSIVPLTEDGVVRGATVVIQDVTALKKAQSGLARLAAELEDRVVERTAEVRQLVGDLTNAERRERGRVAQVLHDDLQQILVAVQFKLEELRRAAEGAGLDALVSATYLLVERAIHTTRTLTVDLNPPVLHGEGLAQTFEWLGHRMSDAYGLDVTVVADDHVEVGKTVQVLLFQIVRELLFNVVKHAGTGEADVRVAAAEGRVRVTVSDAGAGFESEDGSAGVGLVSVRERIRLVGGTVRVTSNLGEGTQIVVDCPIEL